MGGIALDKFLRHVLPPQGSYIYAWKRNDQPGMRQAVAASLAELATRVRRLSAEGYDTYFACSAFTGHGITVTKNGKTSTKFRTAEQVVGTQSFWADLDCGEGKPYPDAASALEDLRGWCEEYEIPTPTIVMSGSGVHAYWTMERTVLPAEWLQIATAFKAFCETSDFPVDPTRAADIASVLRPPETFNYKRGGAAPVEVLSLEPAISVEAFSARFPAVAAIPRTLQRIAPELDKFSNIYAEVPSYPKAIAAQCQWIRAVGPQALGNVAEPVWYAMLGLLVHAEDGEDTAQIWSTGHPGYDYDATEIKMEQARQNQSGPTTCSRFESQWRAGCEGCPHKGKITTPLQLGRRQLPAPAASPPPLDGTPAPAARDDEHIPEEPTFFGWPFAWSLSGGAAVSVKQGDEAEYTIKDIYPYPVFVDTMRRGELTEKAHAVLKHWSPHDHWQTANILAGELTTEGAGRLLGNNHIEVAPANQRDFNAFLSRAKSEYKNHRKTELQHETFGWKDSGFLLGHLLISPERTQVVGISEELDIYAAKLGAVGSVDAWCAAAQQLFEPGYEHQAMAVLAGFGAPLMRFAPYPGAIYAMISDDSGRGKTFSVEAATSIWGDDKALWISHRDDKVSAGDTIKAQYRAMSLFKSLPIIVDEIRALDAEKLRGFITTFTDGSPRKGLSRDGAMRTSFGSWRTIMQVTANASLVDVATANNDPAAANRVFEVQCSLPPNANAQRAGEIRTAMRANYGTAGVAFIRHLMNADVIASVQPEMDALVDGYTKRLQALRSDISGGDRYIASFFACCTITARLLKDAGLLTVDMDRLMVWAFDRWGSQTSQIDQAHRTGAELLSAFVRTNWTNFITVRSDGKGREESPVTTNPTRTPIVGRLTTETGRLLLDQQAILQWSFAENVTFGAIQRELAGAGILLDTNARRNLGAGTPFRGMGQSKVWVIDTQHPAMSGVARDIAEQVENTPIPMKAG